MPLEHPFAPYIRIIGKGPRLSRPLTREEAKEATGMILRGEVDSVQLGAFLCILRVRTEDPGEGAGFIDAVRDELKRPNSIPAVDLDWPTYSGKVRQLPYYVLAALALAQSGIKIFMHGVEGHTDGRLFTAQTLRLLGIEAATSMEDAAKKLENTNFAYLQLEQINPVLQDIIDLKATLGVRTPVNTFARMINAFDAKAVIQCITHSAYRELHRDCAKLLDHKRMCVIKGEGGEIERRPAKPVNVQYLIDGQKIDEEWPAFLDSEHAAHDEVMDQSRLMQIWQGTDTHPYAMAAITGTMAVALKLLGKADTPDAAMDLAQNIWDGRNKDKLIND
ncbi:glycosyl transferase family protein [Terasakiella sp. A23]|uniref:glycosyl transferase family protein n=1 Tax=Terasakiella sp. FCG-A23 TaxID=3080561 RepID=UPI002955A755|nr:glycosyl transferase family protein [Terasakiella sp. A23]MDV7340167.1 glycosyl transferase family protein [Terasakiella sp. A23]